MSSFTLTITQTIPNPLLSRQLIKVKLAHPNSSTPKKDEITKKLAYLFQTDPSLVIVRNCRTAFGLHETTAEAKIYEEISTLNSTEHSYVIARKTGVVADKIQEKRNIKCLDLYEEICELLLRKKKEINKLISVEKRQSIYHLLLFLPMEEIMDKLKEIEGLIDSSKKLPQGIIESLEYESKMLFTYLTLKIALGKLTNTLDIKDLERIKSLKNNFEIVKERKNEIFDEKVENDVLKCLYQNK
ncbi:ribosomal protein S24 [Hamiltosporidium tvaerminnensis]|uniref:Ribosomal protein S24 n=2 Tax=Hamiltosporidium TaxID=1176354 RepID=A0A4Q9LTR4_9MICR|nr:ribosomal protein S24 [Hamiltosporidium tvaerminnensis]